VPTIRAKQASSTANHVELCGARLVTGSSDRGLADPGQLTARSLSLLTRTFVLSRDDAGLRWVIYVDVLDELSQRASDAASALDGAMRRIKRAARRQRPRAAVSS
jgi:hypothetical protein